MAGTINSNIQFGDSKTNLNNFTLTAEANNGSMKLARGNFEATTNDMITIDPTGLTLHAGQIEWPVIPIFSTNANTIDEVKCKGTWIPWISTVSAVTGPSYFQASFGGYPIQSGYYTKIGTLVIATFYVSCGIFTLASASGNLLLRGLPFSGTTTLAGSGCVAASNLPADSLVVPAANGNNWCEIYQKLGTGYVPLTTANAISNMYIEGTIMYFTSD